MQYWPLRASLGVATLVFSSVAVSAQTRMPVTAPLAGVPAQGTGLTVKHIVLKSQRTSGKLRPHSGSAKPSPAELAALRKAGIQPSDPQFKQKARAYFQHTARPADSSMPQRIVTIEILRTHLPNIHVDAQRTATAKMRPFMAIPKARVVHGTPVIVKATAAAAPFPEVKSWVVNGNFVQSFPTSTPNNDYQVTAGDQIMFSGRSLGSSSNPPTVLLTISGCGKVNLNVTATAPDGSYVVTKVPNIAVDWPKMRGYITVNGATGPRLIYVAPLENIQATIWVHWQHGSNGGGHATSDGGLRLGEGSTMITNGGGDRESTVPGWLGGNGGSGSDTYGANVTTLNGWTIPSGGVSASCQSSNHAPFGPAWFASSSGCGVGTTVAPYVYGGNTNSLYTVVNWEYDADHTVDYYVGWSLYGPAGTRPLTTFAKSGNALCES
jgi:hypothetical protein